MKTKTKNLSKIMKTVSLVILMLLSLTIVQIYAADTDTIDGTVTVGNAIPGIDTIVYVDSVGSVETNYDPDDTTIYGVKVTISDTNTLADIKNVTFYLYEDGTHNADYADVPANGYDLINISWTESTGTWETLQQGSNTLWTEQTSVDPGVASGLGTFDFIFRFDISKVAWADTTWNASVVVFDDQEATNSTGGVGFVEMNSYFELDIVELTFTWGTVSTNDKNVTWVANRTVDFFNNAAAEITVAGSDLTSGGESDVDIALLDIVIFDADGVASGTDNFWIRNIATIGVGSWDAIGRMTLDTSPTQLTIHAWFNENGDLVPGPTYDITLTFLVRADT